MNDENGGSAVGADATSTHHMHNSLVGSYSNQRVLVTGGASFIGSHLVELLTRSGATVRVADDLSSGKLENLSTVSADIEFLEGDLREPAFAAHACADQQVVFHLAAQHGGRGYIETHPVECVGNMGLDFTVFDASVRAGAQKIVHASSACVYPTTLQAHEDDRNLLREDDANFDEPGKAFSDGEYGWAKLMGELQLRAFVKQYGISGVACRIFTAYGERENESHAVIALIAKAAMRLDPFPIWGNGLQTRNFTYVLDTVMGMALAGAKLEGFETINVGSPHHHTILELIDEVFDVIGWRPGEIRRELDKPVGVKSRAADVGKCVQLLDWVPEWGLREGVARTTNWYLEEFEEQDPNRFETLLMERN
jgi:nucleoside-diphosphate-sugar epimerase